MAITTSIIEFFQKFIFFNSFSLLSLLIFLIFIYKWAFPNQTTKKNSPPSPPRLPIIGNLHQIGTYPHRNLRILSQKYGDLMLLHLGSKPAIVVTSAEIASEVLKTHDVIFASRPNLSVFRRLLGNDILSSPYGEYWRQLRSICVMQLLSTKRVRSFAKVRQEEVALMMKSIRGQSIVNLSEMFVGHSTDFISRVAFRNKYRGQEGDTDFMKLLDELPKLLGGYYIGDFIPWLSWIDTIGGLDARVNKVNSGFDEFFNRVIEEHSARRSDRIQDGDENDVAMTDFVDVLLEVQDDSGNGDLCIDKQSITSVILNMFSAGSDTTYTVLEWMMSELLRNPRVMKELQKEVREMARNKEMVSEDELENMKYLKAVMKEALRLHPPAPLMAPHESTEDVTINGYEIGAGTFVLVNIWAISRDPAYWDEPESFYPERFLNSTIDYKGQDFQFIPFGAGRRMCPGMAFATTSIELTLANLVHQFDWALPDGESLDMNEAPGISVHRKIPLLAISTPRCC